MSKEPSMAASQQLLHYIRTSKKGEHAAEQVDEHAVSAPIVMLPSENVTFLQKINALLRPAVKQSATLGLTVLPNGFMLARSTISGKQPSISDVRFYALPAHTAPDSPAGIECLRRALSSFAPDYAQCMLWQALPEGSGEMYALHVPKVKAAELDAVALLAARKEKTFDSASTIFDYRVLEEKLNNGVPRLSVLAVALPRANVQHMQQMAGRAGCKLGGLTAPMMYAYNLFASGWLKSPWERFAVVYVEDDASHLAVFYGQDLLLCSSSDKI
jgi:hypothetical protein